MTSIKKPPRVLISYSHDSTVHAARVLELANQLRNHGIDCMIDQYKPTPEEGGGWPLWMERQIEQADFVLCLCSEEYAKRFRLDTEPSVGKGVAWESMLIRNALYLARSANEKFFVVQFDKLEPQTIPSCLQGYTSFVIEEPKFGSADYEKLYRLLTNQPAVIKPEIGKSVELLVKQNEPAEEFISGADFFEFQNRSQFESEIDTCDEPSDAAKVKQLCEIWRSKLRAFQFAEAEAIAGDASKLNSIQLAIDLAKNRVDEFCSMSKDEPKQKNYREWTLVTSIAILLTLFFTLPRNEQLSFIATKGLPPSDPNGPAEYYAIWIEIDGFRSQSKERSEACRILLPEGLTLHSVYQDKTKLGLSQDEFGQSCKVMVQGESVTINAIVVANTQSEDMRFKYARDDYPGLGVLIGGVEIERKK